MKTIHHHIRLASKGVKSFTMAVNEYSDLTFREFKRKMTGYMAPPSGIVDRTRSTDFSPVNEEDLPEDFDWRDLGCVTPVKNQGDCGSCWAFSTTGAIEGCHAIATGRLVSLSEQQLLDCSGNYGNHGCGGGWMQSAFKYVVDQKGINTEDFYPYETAIAMLALGSLVGVRQLRDQSLV